MKMPRDFIKDYVFSPIYRFHSNYLSKFALHSGAKKIADFIYKYGGDPALNMIVFNSICIISSHINQINGLRKSKRENKDYLVQQEIAEFALDGLFSVIPPFFIHMIVAEKIESGEWITKSAKKNMENVIAYVCGVAKSELFDTSHLTKIDEFLPKLRDRFLYSIKKFKYTPLSISSKINVTLPDPNQQWPRFRTDEFTKRADKLKKGGFDGFFNRSAFAELSSQKNGLIMISALLYTAFVCSVLTPVLKNLIANYFYKKTQKKSLEKNNVSNRFDYTRYSIEEKNSKFSVFSNFDNTISSTSKPNVMNSNPFDKNVSKTKNPFESFSQFSELTTYSNNMKV